MCEKHIVNQNAMPQHNDIGDEKYKSIFSTYDWDFQFSYFRENK